MARKRTSSRPAARPVSPMVATGNPERVAAIQGLRRSNAATAIPAGKVRRQGSRSSAKRAAIRDY